MIPITARGESVLLCMYAGLPEPPTLNALLVMSHYFRVITFLRNNLSCPPDSYPVLPKLVEVGGSCDFRVAQTKGSLWKLSRFARYCWALHKYLRSRKYKLVVFHDDLALLAFWLVRRSAGYSGLAWFNSYDVIDRANVRLGRFSLLRLVVAKQKSLFAQLDYFSLPSAERKPCYPIQKVKRETFVIPNFPAVEFYGPFYKPKVIGEEIKLIYQGALGRGHGFENIIRLLTSTVRGKPLHLTLKGWIADDYCNELTRLAAECGVSHRLSFVSFGPYRSVPELASTCTIGLAIFTGRDVMNQTLGTASNKIYEYAALGLPVVLIDSPHFRDHLGHRKWAFFTDLTERSLIEIIERIMVSYSEASRAAVEDFRRELNFERIFTPALQRIVETLSDHEHAHC